MYNNNNIRITIIIILMMMMMMMMMMMIMMITKTFGSSDFWDYLKHRRNLPSYAMYCADNGIWSHV